VLGGCWQKEGEGVTSMCISSERELVPGWGTRGKITPKQEVSRCSRSFQPRKSGGAIRKKEKGEIPSGFALLRYKGSGGDKD